jgi:hypothetical protein
MDIIHLLILAARTTFLDITLETFQRNVSLNIVLSQKHDNSQQHTGDPEPDRNHSGEGEKRTMEDFKYVLQ